MAFSLRRASSITSANSQDSLEDFLSEVSEDLGRIVECYGHSVADRQFLGKIHQLSLRRKV